MKKTKKRIKIAAVIIVILCAVGAAVYFALPYIRNFTDPSRKAIEAMKNARTEATDRLSSDFDGLISSLADGSVNGYTGYVTFDKASYEKQDLLQFIKTNTVSYSYAVKPSEKKAAGSIALATGAETSSVAEVDFYIDDTTLYFKVPKLSSYNFKLKLSDADKFLKTVSAEGVMPDIDLGFDLDDVEYIKKLFGTVDADGAASYSRMAESLLNDIGEGLDKAIEEFTYEKTGNVSYIDKTGSYSADTTCYKVTVTKEALTDGADAAIDAIYDDDAIASYRTLFSSYYKNSKEKLKESVRRQLEDFETFTFTIYVGDDNRIVAYEFGGEDGGAVVESTEKGALTYASYSVTYDGVSASYSTDRLDASAVQFSYDVEANDASVSLVGKAESTEAAALPYTAADFTNPLDVTELTNSQYQSILMQALEHIDVLGKIISVDGLFE